MRRADRREREHTIRHAKVRNHVARIETAHAVRDDVDRLGWKFPLQEAFEFLRAFGDTARHAEPRLEHSIARGAKCAAMPRKYSITVRPPTRIWS